MDTKICHKNDWMRLALREAKKGWGTTNPNPMVGAVIVKNGVLLGAGHHEYAGGLHAEINALQAAGKKSRGADIYVTMEPCSTYGRTPPCTMALINAGIRRVYIGSVDDNPKHAGAAVKILRDAGIEVEVGILEKECRALNKAFFWWIQHHRPYVILKMAQSLDGRIALANGDSKWISGPASRRQVQKLRKLSDMIMVGGATVRIDNPSLIVKDSKWTPQPDVCIWSGQNLPRDLQLFGLSGRSYFQCKPVSRRQWLDFLTFHGKRECEVLLIEGGGELAASALKAGIVNEIVWFVAPKIIGGRLARPVVGGDDISVLSDAIALGDLSVRRCGEDLMITAYPVVAESSK